MAATWNPANDFMPFPGVVGKIRLPEIDGIRFDAMIYEGYAIPPFYDSLLGKLIVHGKDRGDAIDKLRRALDELSIEGIKHTSLLHKSLASDHDVQAGQFHTQFLEPWLEANPLTAD